MDNKLKQWFSSIFLDLFQSQVKHYLMSFTDRLIPTFSQLGRECEEFEHRESQRMRCLVDPEIDYGDFAQLIHDRTIDYYISLSNIRQGLINLLTAGLYHLFEQQVSRFVATSPNKSISKTELFDRFEKILGYWNCTTSSLPHWDILTNELRLVANTVKHGGSLPSNIERLASL